MQLDDRSVIVTGAGSGIGRAACQAFADAGARVVAFDRDDDRARDAAAAVGGEAVSGDVGDAGDWDRALDVAGDRLGAAYLNAGLYGDSGPIEQLPLDVYERTVGANIGGVVLGTRACIPRLRAAGGGAIVVTASVAGIIAFEPNPLYTLTKQAVIGFVRASAAALSADGITIDAVCPAVVDTPMTTEALGQAAATDLGISLLTPELIAATAVDLATSDGSGRCRAVRQDGTTVDWSFPTWHDLAEA